MRFHIGLSFRFKTLKKFLFPFLLGILTYILSSGISFLNVYAASTNLDTYYIYDFKDLDLDNIIVNEKPLSYYLHYFDNLNDYYYTIPYLEYNTTANYYSITYYLTPISADSIYQSVYFKNSTSTTQFVSSIYSSNNQVWKRQKIQSNYNSTMIDNALNVISSCLTSNSCSGLSAINVTEFLGGTYAYSTLVSNNSNYNANYKNGSNGDVMDIGGFIYSSPIPIYFVTGIELGNKVFYKSLLWNGETKVYNDLLPTYYDLNNGGNNDDDNNFFQVVDNRFRSLYLNLDKSDLSSLSLNYTYAVYNIDNYDSNLDMIPFWYYGRKNNGTYYSYESINCSNSSSVSSNENVYDFTFNNFTCTSDLTNYDKIYIYTTQKYIDDSIPMFIYGLDVNTSANIYYGNYLGVLYENFDNLNSGFKLLLSTYDDYNPCQVNVITDNDYVGFDLIENSNSTLTLETRGDWFFSCQHNGICTIKFGNKIYNKNLLIYDDLSYSNVSSTNLKLFLEDNIIVSIVNNNSVSYYDNNGNIVSNNIFLTYDSTDNSNLYDISDVFSKVNDYIDSLEEDMFTFHNLIDSCYEVLPEIIQNLISIIYMLSLTYLVFKVIRK